MSKLPATTHQFFLGTKVWPGTSPLTFVPSTSLPSPNQYRQFGRPTLAWCPSHTHFLTQTFHHLAPLSASLEVGVPLSSSLSSPSAGPCFISCLALWPSALCLLALSLSPVQLSSSSFCLFGSIFFLLFLSFPLPSHLCHSPRTCSVFISLSAPLPSVSPSQSHGSQHHLFIYFCDLC